MKTAISIPDPIYRAAEAFAKRNRLSRSALFTEAVKTFIDQKSPAEITERLNQVYGRESSQMDAQLEKMQAQSLGREKW